MNPLRRPRSTYRISLQVHTKEADAWGTDLGARVSAEINRTLVGLSEGTVVVFDYAGIRRSDASFQREAVVETIRRHHPRLLFVVEGIEDRLSHRAKDRASFDALFAPTYSAQVRLAPDGTPAPTPELGSVDVISAGAIAQATLFALIRIPAVRGKVRVIEPDTSDLTNLNRNAFLRRRRATLPKARDLAELCAQTEFSVPR